MITGAVVGELLTDISAELVMIKNAIDNGLMLSDEQWDMLAALYPLLNDLRQANIRHSIDVLKEPATPMMRRWSLSAVGVNRIYHEKDQ